MNFFEQHKAEMIAYVKNMLNQYETSGSSRKQRIGYSRFEHTMRVYKWMEKLYAANPNKANIDLEVLSIATIFHDIGYCSSEKKENHAKNSAIYCREYLQSKKYSSEKTDFICDIVSRHSDKETMHEDIPEELLLLMEADLLDDTGALGLVLDVWLEAEFEEHISFQSILEHMQKYTLAIMQHNPMKTDEGIRLWNEKKALTEAFVQSYKEDLEMDL